VLPYRHAARLVSLTILLTSLTACANSQTGKTLEQTLRADPTLKGNPITVGPSNDSTQLNTAIVPLPTDFPKAEIPLYPGARLKEVTQPTAQANGKSANPATVGDGKLTRWVSSDPSNLIESFYQKQLQSNNWKILTQPTNEQPGTIQARRNNLQVTVSIAGQNPQALTEFVIQYVLNSSETVQAPIANTPPAVSPQPVAPNSTGSVPPSDVATPPVQTPDTKTPVASVAASTEVFTDLNQVPQELHRYVEDLAKLGALPLEPDDSKSNKSATETQFGPSKTVSRREFARWLFTANNKIHANSPAQQIHLASQTAQPAFQDIPPTDPDFPIIQGLAEAGLMPSPLSGDSTTILFRPNAPLTREQMILQKVPLDTRHALPNASVDAVKQTWGFQDAARIAPQALRAVLADFQNGEQSNIRRVFGYTTLFQPQKLVTRAEAAAALWYFGTQGEGLSAQDALQFNKQQSPQSATPTPTPSSSASQSPSTP